MKIDAILTPYFPEKENQFNGAVVVMLDVLRASTTVCSALHNGAKEIIPTETQEKAVQIFGNLSREARFLGGERGGIKPNGFDAGNSPGDYSFDAVGGKSVIFTTSNGTKVFQKAKQASIRLIAGFVNLSPVLDYIFLNYLKPEDNYDFYFLCAGNDGRISYEDTLCAGAYISEIYKRISIAEMSDSAHMAMNLYNLHASDLSSFLSSREHATKLKELGFFKDIELCLTFDLYPVIPVFSGNSIKKIG